MDFLVGILVLLLWLLLFVLSYTIDFKLMNWMKKGRETIVIKVWIGILFGFLAFIIVTPKIPRFEQRLAVSAMILVFVGISVFRLREKNGE
ncbi:hypothetical protein ACFLT9_06200 [Acidobacteriota bacterium]